MFVEERNIASRRYCFDVKDSKDDNVGRGLSREDGQYGRSSRMMMTARGQRQRPTIKSIMVRPRENPFRKKGNT